MLRKKSFITSAKLFKSEIDHRLREFAEGHTEDILSDIRDALSLGESSMECVSVLEYLDAIIGGNKKRFLLIKTTCGGMLFQKLLNAGLKKV